MNPLMVSEKFRCGMKDIPARFLFLKTLGCLVCGVSLPVFLSACSVTAGSTEGTSDSFQNTTESAGQSTEASSGFTSSTSPRGDDSSHEPAEKEVELSPEQEAFIRRNNSLILADISAGEGEYIAAVAEMLHVENREQFFSNCQNRYSDLSEKNLAPRLARLAAL